MAVVTHVVAAISDPFIPSGTELWALAPELCLVGAMVAVLLAPFFARKSNGLCATVAFVGLLAAFVVTLTAGGGR